MPSLTWFDGAALVVVLVSAVQAYNGGIIRDIFGIVALLAAIAAAYMFSGDVTAIAGRVLPADGGWHALIVPFALFLVVYFSIKSLAGRIAGTIDHSQAGGAIDRGLGFLYGAARGVLLVSLLVLALKGVAGDPKADRRAFFPESITHAATYPLYDGVANAIAAILPKSHAAGVSV